VRLNLRVEPPHDPAYGNRAYSVANQHGLPGKLALGPVECNKPLAGLGLPDHYPALTQPVEVESVERLAKLQHNAVGDVDDVVDRAYPKRLHPVFEPFGGWAYLYTLYNPGCITRASFRIVYGDRCQRLDRRTGFIDCYGRVPYRCLTQRGHLSGNANDGEAVSSVRSDRNLHQDVPDPQGLIKREPDRRVGRKNPDAAV